MRDPYGINPNRSVTPIPARLARVVTDLLEGDSPGWEDRALCAQTDPEAFFPGKGGSAREAKRICSRCEVKADCLEYALDRKIHYGIWGGLSERDRRKLYRQAAA